MPEIMSQLPDGGEIKIPNMLDVMSKQAQTEKYNLDVAGAARNFYALKQHGEGAARGDPEATIQLNAKNPEAGNILANIGKTTIETKQAKENLAKGLAARVAQTASQFDDPAQQTSVLHNGIDLAVSQGMMTQADADNYKNMAALNPQRVIDAIIHGNLTAAQTPLIAGQTAQRTAEGQEPSEARLRQQTGSYGQPIKVDDIVVRDKDGNIVYEADGKTPKTQSREYNPTYQPGAIRPGPGGGPTINRFGVPTRPGSGSSGPGSVSTSGVVTAPSTYVPGSGTSSAPAIPAPPDEFKGIISEAASKHGVPEELLTRVLHAESGYDPNNVGPMTRHGTAKGIAQFIDSTARSRGVNQFDPASSIDGAAAYLAQLYKERGSWQGAMRGYLGGPPKPGSSYYKSGVVQHARQLDNPATGVAPPAPPGSTASPPAPGSSLPIPGPAGTAVAPVPGAPTATTPELAPPSPGGAAPGSGSTTAPEPEATSGGSTATTAPSAGEDTVSPPAPAPYDTTGTESARTIVAEDRGSTEVLTPAQKKQREQYYTDPGAIERNRIEEENKADITSQEKAFNASVGENKEAINGQMQLHIVENALSKVTTGLTGPARQTLYRGISEIGHMLNLDTSDTREDTARDRLVKLFNKAGAEAGSQSAYMALISTSGSQLAFSMVKALGSREAVQVVDQVMRIKPNLGLDNEENQAIVNALRQGFQRTVDKHAYLLEHRRDKGGIFKAESDFEKEKPAAMYASRVIPFPVSSPENMINGVRYDLATIRGKQEEYKGKIGVWDSKKGAFAEE